MTDDFSAFVLSYRGRPGPIGEFIEAVALDPTFPLHGSYAEVRAYFDGLDPDGVVQELIGAIALEWSSFVISNHIAEAVNPVTPPARRGIWGAIQRWRSRRAAIQLVRSLSNNGEAER